MGLTCSAFVVFQHPGEEKDNFDLIRDDVNCFCHWLQCDVCTISVAPLASEESIDVFLADLQKFSVPFDDCMTEQGLKAAFINRLPNNVR